MTAAVVVIVLLVLGRVAWWWFIARNRPEFPPLAIDDNDSLMVEARREARESIPLLRELFPSSKEFARVKVPFVTNANEREFLWAELLSLDESNMQVRYITPPVTHTGKLERVHVHPVSDLADWLIAKEPGPYVGGYTMRVMFKRAREQWGDLPPELKAEEAKYDRA
jgi:uncharacterized protein YegJ (DUF2314 family)